MSTYAVGVPSKRQRFAIVTMFRKDQHGAQSLGNLPHEALEGKGAQGPSQTEAHTPVETHRAGRGSYSVVAEPGDVALIAGVEQNGSSGLLPVSVCHEIPLFERAVL